MEINLGSAEQGEAKISNELLEIWGITKEELNVTAIANEKLYNPFIVKPMDLIMKELICNDNTPDESEEFEIIEEEGIDNYPDHLPRLYVLLNKKRSKAAVGIMDMEI